MSSLTLDDMKPRPLPDSAVVAITAPIPIVAVEPLPEPTPIIVKPVKEKKKKTGISKWIQWGNHDGRRIKKRRRGRDESGSDDSESDDGEQ